MNSAATSKAHGGGTCSLSRRTPPSPLTFTSLYGPSKTHEDTEKALQNILPTAQTDQGKVYRIAYLVHEIVEPASSNVTQEDPPANFIGLITLRSLSAHETTFLPRLHHGSTPTTLSLELAYMFLPTSWGRGYATESITAMLDACGRVQKEFWQPWEKVYVRAIVNDENKPSERVMEKCMLQDEKGSMEVVEFEGGRFFIAGKWREKHRLYVYGREVVG
jgi:RimJ/RimL family protein N-acetyltransferase